jgi:hypothetical protein
MPRYSVGVYNAEVRQLLKEGRRHRDLSDRWAEIHYVDFTAESPEEARLKAGRRYPKALGYIITDVMDG